MSIEEKLATVGENVSKVYEAGYKNGYNANSQGGGELNSFVALRDEAFHITYKLYVSNGKLMLSESEE